MIETPAISAPFEPPPPRLRPITAGELLRLELPPRENILAPWLPTKGLALVYAYRRVGKTHLGLGIAFAVASGGRFLNGRQLAPGEAPSSMGRCRPAVLQERLARIAEHATLSRRPRTSSVSIAADLHRDGIPDSPDRRRTAGPGAAHRRCRADHPRQPLHPLPSRKGERVPVRSGRRIQESRYGCGAKGGPRRFRAPRRQEGCAAGHEPARGCSRQLSSTSATAGLSSRRKAPGSSSTSRRRGVSSVAEADASRPPSILSAASGPPARSRTSARDRSSTFIADGLKPAEIAKELKSTGPPSAGR